jgi:hypothetical protein
LRLQFSVEDTGVGIPANKITHLFEPFTQADGSTTRDYGGTGLGLSISRQLTELMGGSISATSQPGKGSCFKFSLPFGIGKEISLPRPKMSLRGLSVLLVDDNPTMLEALGEMLSSLTFQVKAVSSGARALEEIHGADTAYDLVLF